VADFDDVVKKAIVFAKNTILGGDEHNRPFLIILGWDGTDWRWGHLFIDEDGDFNIEAEKNLNIHAGSSVTGVITSNPSSGEYKVKGIRLDSSKNIVVTYDDTPEP
jgi:hypothetical protein